MPSLAWRGGAVSFGALAEKGDLGSWVSLLGRFGYCQVAGIWISLQDGISYPDIFIEFFPAEG
ncbi:hypothetical protein RZS08_61780, partial [Arthrospira platensis SPKY1]|nr:hypothetical protein [Arthrospira platensis SPKY1]